jgi:hypothetical protein
MLNRPCRSSLISSFCSLTICLGALALAGCGDDLSDDPYGFIDLAPYYYDGSTPAAPTTGLTRVIFPQRGWMNGARAEYYDFGLVGFVRSRTNNGQIPDYAQVPAMYFFFDMDGNPLFSPPIYEKRTGLWHMKGGRNTLDPNPREDAPKNVPYSVRIRDSLGDFQRPIIDRLQANTDYSGLWEIWEVTAPRDYVPDAIKQLSTLNKALNSGGDWRLRRTTKVINCPVVDERQSISPSPLWYGVPHPRIELWYRTKQGSCFLADGWLALGDMDKNLYKADSDDARLNMFEVLAYTIGADKPGARTNVVARVQKMYIPNVRVAFQDPTRGAMDIRFTGESVTNAGPRMRPSDPPGYSPLRWMWDLRVPQDPPFEPGTYKRLEQMDPGALSNRLTSDTPYVRNMPLIGTAISCTGDDTCASVAAAPGITLQCNKTPFDTRFPGGDAAVVDPPPGKTVDDLILLREGGPRCDIPAVTFGEFCAPGIARCRFDIKGTDDERPFVNGTMTTQNLLGYTCQPMGTGYCYYRCDTDAGTAGSGAAMTVPVEYNGPSGQVKKDTGSLPFENRCGNLPGYRCLNPSPTTPGVPSRLRVCLRGCDTGKPDPYNAVFCGEKTAANLRIGTRFDGNIQKGMTCTSRGIDTNTSTPGCQWDPAYEPRDRDLNFLPR